MKTEMLKTNFAALSEMALDRMDQCQERLRMIDRLMEQSRGKVSGKVWGSLEDSQRYWMAECETAAEEHFHARASIEETFVQEDKEKNR